MTPETITITKPVTADLFVQDKDPFSPRPEPSVHFGTLVLEPGTYSVDHIDPPDHSVGITFGTVVFDLGEGSFAEVDHDDVVEAV
jgi:hypothetical protein